MKVTQPLIAGIGSKSTPILMDAIGMYLAQTYNLKLKLKVKTLRNNRILTNHLVLRTDRQHTLLN